MSSRWIVDLFICTPLLYSHPLVRHCMKSGRGACGIVLYYDDCYRTADEREVQREEPHTTHRCLSARGCFYTYIPGYSIQVYFLYSCVYTSVWTCITISAYMQYHSVAGRKGALCKVEECECDRSSDGVDGSPEGMVR